MDWEIEIKDEVGQIQLPGGALRRRQTFLRVSERPTDKKLREEDTWMKARLVCTSDGHLARACTEKLN